MRHLLSLASWRRADLAALFARADAFCAGRAERIEGAAVLFFPATSLRTRVSFEIGAAGLGLQPITFPPETLDKSEDLADVIGYLSSWASLVVARHRSLAALERMAGAGRLPVINAMTDENHPCEVLSDLFALSQLRDVLAARYVIVGPDGNIARAWWEAGAAFGLDVRQSCPEGLRVPGMPWEGDLRRAIAGADIVVTDGPGVHVDAMAPYRVTAELLDAAPAGVLFAPCPPFVRGREVSADAIEHRAFVGYGFKKSLVPVQQAIMAWALGRE